MYMCIYIWLHVIEIFISHCCLGIDKCTTGDHNCKVNEYCVNKPGGFICKCASGFKSVDNTCEGIMYISCSYICS